MNEITVNDVAVYYEVDTEAEPHGVVYAYLDPDGITPVAEVTGTSEYSITSAVQQAVTAQTQRWRSDLQGEHAIELAETFFGKNPYKYEPQGFFTRFFLRLFGG